MIFHQAYIQEIFKRHLGPFADAIETKSPELYSGIINAICAAQQDAQDFLDWFWSEECNYRRHKPGFWQHVHQREEIITTRQLHSLFISLKNEKAKDNQGDKANDPRT